MEANKKHKDSVFTLLFKDKERLISLYNAVSGSNYTNDVELEINTLEDALFMDRLNDISFVIDDKFIILIEHQSTKNKNLPLRCLLYVARLYEKILAGSNIYREKLIKISTPQFIVCYNGEDKLTEEDRVLKLSDAFKGEGNQNLELTVRVIDVNKDRGDGIIKKSKPLSEYAEFIAIVREFREKYTDFNEAMKEAVKYCISKEILKEFLEQHGSEVHNMLFTEFNIDDAKKIWREEAREDGLAEGLTEGKEKAKIEMALEMLANGEPIKTIMKYTKLTEEKINSLRLSEA